MKQRKAIIVIIVFTYLVACFLIVLSGTSTRAIVMAEATVTPVVQVYLPLISRQSRLIYSSQNLKGHSVVPECNPGNGTSCACSEADVSLLPFDGYGEVTSNVREVHTYVNAIGHKKFIENFPDGKAISLGVYEYIGQVNLPTLPISDVNRIKNPQAIHMMIQLWDGRNALFQSNKTTLEGTIYWELNPWSTEYGKIKVYTKPITLTDTGIILTPISTTQWHTFTLVVDLRNQKYVSITIDGETRNLSNFELARVPQPSWGKEVSLSITTESLASWPQQNCTNVFSWSTRFRDLEFRIFP